MKRELIVENGVYVDATLTRWRRVIALVDEDDEYVRYSVGTDVNRHCLLRTFARWACKRITVDADGMVEEYEETADES